MTTPHFFRKMVQLETVPAAYLQTPRERAHRPARPAEQEQQVLVINGSGEMAGAITRQLRAALPNASIMYAPTIELAGWILRTRQIDLIISSDLLPDGGTHKLHRVIEQLRTPPDLLIVGRSVRRSVQELRKVGYQMVSRTTLLPPSKREEPPRSSRSLLPRAETVQPPAQPPRREEKLPEPSSFSSRVSSLGADLRNDLNNPLQEIVTMAFVARQSQAQQELSHDALQAIERAAKQLAGTVSGLEDRIRAAVAE
ncbi:hypothetical protein MRY87_11590 [bacterium]|nr:hypothetical protein [bacterium]